MAPVRRSTIAVRTDAAFPTIPFIVDTGEAFEVRGLGDVQTFDDRAEAFAVIEASDWFVAGIGRKGRTEDLAEPRWFDAAAEEPAPSVFDGSQITERGVFEMAANLNAHGSGIPIDGAGVSEVHQSAYDSAAPAAGWVYGATVLYDVSGRAHLWLYAQALPHVDQLIDSKQLQYGSIAFYEQATHKYSGDDVGAWLLSYALTNMPFVDGLEPHAQRSNVSTGATLVVIREKKVETMTTKKTAGDSATPKQAVRGPLLDVLTEAAALFAVDLDKLDNDTKWEMADRLYALYDAARSEQLVDEITGATPPNPGEDSGESGERSGGDENAEPVDGAAMEAFASDVVAELTELFGEGEPSELLESLKGSREAFKAALAGEDPPEETNDVTDGERAGARSGIRSAAADELAALRAENAALRATSMIDAEIASAIKGKADAVSDEDRARYHSTSRSILVGLSGASEEDRAKAVRSYIRDVCSARVAPDSGTVLDPSPKVRTQNGTPATFADAREIAEREIKIEDPTISRKKLSARSYELVRSRWPELLQD